MGDFMGISIIKIIELVLSILGIVFLIIEKVGTTTSLFLITAITVSYLILVVVMTCAHRDITGSGSVGIECALGLGLFMWSLGTVVGGGNATLVLVAAIMNVVLAVLFWITALF